MFYYLHRDEAYRSGRQSSSCGCQTASLAPPHTNLYRLDDQYARNPNQPSLHSTLLGQQRHRENAPLGPRMICREQRSWYRYHKNAKLRISSHMTNFTEQSPDWEVRSSSLRYDESWSGQKRSRAPRLQKPHTAYCRNSKEHSRSWYPNSFSASCETAHP